MVLPQNHIFHHYYAMQSFCHHLHSKQLIHDCGIRSNFAFCPAALNKSNTSGIVKWSVIKWYSCNASYLLPTVVAHEGEAHSVALRAPLHQGSQTIQGARQTGGTTESRAGESGLTGASAWRYGSVKYKTGKYPQMLKHYNINDKNNNIRNLYCTVPTLMYSTAHYNIT